MCLLLIIKNLQSPTKVLAHLHTFAISVREIISSSPFLKCCLLWWSCHCSLTTLLGGRGLSILVMPLGIVPQIPCQHISILSDPGMPRTIVVECISPLYENCYNLSSVQQVLWKIEVLSLLVKDFLMITCNHVEWLLTRKIKQKNMSNLWPKTGLSCLKIWVIIACERALGTVFGWETKWLFTTWSLMRSGCCERVGLSAGTGKLCIFGNLGLVFIWSCFVSCLLIFFVLPKFM